MNRHPIAQQIKKERIILAGAVLLLLCLIGAYMYFVSASIIHVVIRKEMNHDIRVLQGEVATLEAEFISAQHAVSADIASLQGYVATPKKIFLDPTPSSLVLGSSQ